MITYHTIGGLRIKNALPGITVEQRIAAQLKKYLATKRRHQIEKMTLEELITYEIEQQIAEHNNAWENQPHDRRNLQEAVADYIQLQWITLKYVAKENNEHFDDQTIIEAIQDLAKIQLTKTAAATTIAMMEISKPYKYFGYKPFDEIESSGTNATRPKKKRKAKPATKKTRRKKNK